jgi:hypothetical protein
MLIFWIWIIKRFNLFYGFSEGDITQSFALPVLLTYIIIFIVVFLFIPINDDDNGTQNINRLFSTVIVSFVITFLLYVISVPSDLTTLIKTEIIKESTTTIIPSEGVEEAYIISTDTGSKIEPSTLKVGEQLTLVVKADGKTFKKDFYYSKEKLKIVRGKKDEVKKAFVETKQFKDELFGKTRERQEEKFILEFETSDLFYIE